MFYVAINAINGINPSQISEPINDHSTKIQKSIKVFDMLTIAFKPRAIVLALATAFISSNAKAQFVNLGDLPGGTVFSTSFGISKDGSVVVGWSRSTSGVEAFRWTADGTPNGSMLGLDDLLGGTFASQANAVNADGSVIVGSGNSGNGSEAFRWTAADGMVGLGDLAGGTFRSIAYGVNADGSVIVGLGTSGNGTEAFRWTAAGGMIGLGDLPGGIFSSTARAVNEDGSVIVGISTSGSGSEAFRWTAADGMVGLGDLAGGIFSSQANAVNADGSVVVGMGTGASGGEAFRWTTAGGMVGLGDLPGGGFSSTAHAVNADGSVVVGQGLTGIGNEAFRWTQADGMQRLADWLSNAGVTIANGYRMTIAKGVSGDGSVVTGDSTGPNGTEAFIARVSSVGSGSITLNDLQTSLTSSVQASNVTLNVAHTVINGLHSRPMSRRISDAQDKAFWLAGDWGTDKHSSRNGELGIAEAGLGRSFNWGQLNASLGQTWANQRLAHSGQAKLNGMFLAAEALIPLSGNLWAILGGYSHLGKADINRGYINAGSQSFSNATPDIKTNGFRTRIEMHQAYGISGIKFSPYTDLSFAESAIEAYTESNGGFPARFAKRKEKATEFRLGVNLEKPMGNVLLLGSLEAAHRIEKRGANISGEVLGLFDFNLNGVKNQQDWLRLGAGVESKLADGKGSLMLNVTNRGEAPSYWLSAKWQKAF